MNKKVETGKINALNQWKQLKWNGIKGEIEESYKVDEMKYQTKRRIFNP